MSREIKFRAWDKDEKRMLEVYRIGFDGPIDGAQVYCYLDDRGAKGSKECFYDGDGLTLEQFTGLKDANGKEIYEGDILKVPFSKSVGEHYDPVTLGYIDCDWFCDTDLIGKVVLWPSTGPRLTQIHADDPEQFDKDHAVPKTYYVTRGCEVIGNIYENMELLEEDK